ncbi:cation channel family protein (macronuclear) [Tetrahymena thermophila SB210]|uniref:Cation channel family protein n=1 Tax=Tetrahymena thermophila (strain SB210) TaxID=312017 RepID=Q22M88_TETTS|nr:cation channel family protein [Tetrahymena thermophila SB210]EAR86278.3 cation channel family protein [Tetrahymena thermophila SB210]|eukprot:XP_977132.3 cation channel family protein [Tetrahymena thermophila SB210]
MGPKHLYFNSIQMAKEGESYFSMKNIPESMENTQYPTQNEDLIKIEKGLNANQCQLIYEDVQKLTKADNSFQFTEDALHQLNNQCLSNTIELNEDKLYPSCLEDEKIQINEETNKKFVTKSSVSTSQICCSRKKYSSDFNSSSVIKKYLQLNKQDQKSKISTFNIPNMSPVCQRIVQYQEMLQFEKVVISNNFEISKNDSRLQQLKTIQDERRKKIFFKKSWLQILYYIGKMKRIMCQTILFFRPHMLSQWQLKIINDVASDFTIQQSSIQNSTRNQNYKRIIKRYNTHFMKQANTITYEESQEKDFHLSIITKYLFGAFILDAVSILSLLNFFLPYEYVILLFFVKIFNFSKIINKIQEKLVLSSAYTSGIVSFVILFLKALYFCHIFSCGFLKLGLYQIQNDKGWLIHYEIDSVNRWTQYLYSYYFSVITMTTIGYGDITAQTEIEKFFMIFFTIISCGIFGYTINSIVDIALQNKARKYLEFVNSEKFSDNYVSTDSSLSSLSSYLQNEIKLNTCKKVLDKFQILTQLFSEQFRQSLSSKMKELELAPEQFIFKQGQCIEPAIYFINCGVIQIVNEKCNTSNKQEIQSLKHGEIFGIEDFFGEVNEKKFSFKSKDSSSMFYLTQSDFQQELKKYPDQVEAYCYLRDSIQFNFDYSKISKPCFSCKRYTHALNKCPYLFYGTNESRIIQNYNREIGQIVKAFERKSFNKVNSLSIERYVKQKADEFLLSNQRHQMIQSRIQFSELELDQQDDETFLANCSQMGYKDFQLNNNQHLIEEQIEQSQPSSVFNKFPSQQFIHMISTKDQQKNANIKTFDSSKFEVDNVLTQMSSSKINNKEPYENAQLYYFNSQNLIKTLDIDAEMMVKNQIKSNSNIQNDFTTVYEKSQILIQSQFSKQKSQQQSEMQNSQNSSNAYYSNQQNINGNSGVLLKLPLGKSNATQKKEKSNSIEQVISFGNIPYSKTQTFKSQSIQDQGGLGLFYQATQQNFTELKEMMYSIMNYFQHQELIGSVKKQKKIFEDKQKANWSISPQLIGDLDLDSLHNYKTYFPNYNIDKVIKKMKLKLAIAHMKINQNSLVQSAQIKNSQKQFTKQQLK